MSRTRFAVILSGAALVWSAAAAAHEAWVTRRVNVRAGPDATYPVVAVLGSGVGVDVVGCVSDYSWCDVVFNGDRGWVPGRRLQYAYQSRRVPLYDYGAAIGLPVVSFSLLNYWDDHYRARSWYGDRSRFYSAPRANWSYERNPRDRNWRDHGPQYREQQPQFREQRHEPPYQPPQYQPRQERLQYGQPRPVEPQFRQPDPQYRGQPQYAPPEGQRGGRQQQQMAPQPMPQAQPVPQAQPLPAPQPRSRTDRPEGPRAIVDAAGRVSVPLETGGH